jgi:hypothetical protein
MDCQMDADLRNIQSDELPDSMKNARANELLLFAAVAILCANGGGCAPRSLVPLGTSPERHASIRGMSLFSLMEGAELVAIDGQKLIFTNSADVSPGPHVARVCLIGPFSGGYQKCEDLRFVAEGGHNYVVCGTSVGWLETRIYLWIEDSQTGKMIAGEKP